MANESFNIGFGKYDHVNVCFHIGRGGRFFNAGYKTFNPHVTTLRDCFGDAIIISEDENGNELPGSSWQLIDSGGNIILAGRDEIESATGVLDWDGEYDTDIVKPISDCTDEEYQLILDAANDGEYVDGDVLDYACEALGLVRVHSIHVYPSNMELFCQDGVHTLYRDSYSVYTEDEVDEVREYLAEQSFSRASIERIIDEMETNEWFSEVED